MLYVDRPVLFELMLNQVLWFSKTYSGALVQIEQVYPHITLKSIPREQYLTPRRPWHCIPFPLQEMFTQKAVNPEMLRSRNIYFFSFDGVISRHISVLKIFTFFLDGKCSCYGNLFVKMHGVLGIQAINFQLDSFLTYGAPL